MYRLYVIDKVRKGQEAVHEGKTLTVEELKRNCGNGKMVASSPGRPSCDS